MREYQQKALEVEPKEHKEQRLASKREWQRNSREETKKDNNKRQPSSRQQQNAFNNQPTVPGSEPHDNDIAKRPEVEIEESIKKAITTTTRTDRGNNKH